MSLSHHWCDKSPGRTTSSFWARPSALSRSSSPALIAEYQTQLPDKALLRAKLHEFYLQNTHHLTAEEL